MNYIDISVLAISLTVILSGVYVNFQRKSDDSEKLKVATDNTLLIFRIAVPVSLITSIAIYFTRWGNLGFNPSIYLGFLLAALGIFVRWYSIHSLGRSFQVNVTIMKDQQLVTNGIYKRIRHPSYTGLLLYYLGLGLVMHNYISILILLIGPLFAVAMRIRKEEAFLADHFGEDYIAYSKSSSRLIPFIY
ncbi:MAG: isoprenylcysteine carboxylmethyltransferase family protein [Crocinitomicaceae bacterium]|nr:isoprenylcysteine carboxylmethyltransferase family protein [Flavobacteriales bacterium]NQZ34211.1 isoprenylcysteine carboxylmethyltransferase family protein [Crocinitomicaceae bacterium]